MSGKILSYLLGFWSAVGVFWLARKHKRRILYKLIGIDVELLDARTDERERVHETYKSKISAVVTNLAEDLANSNQAREKELLRVQLAALSVLNMDNDNSKKYTFWRRKTVNIQSDINKLRAVAE
jgi:hypothetical protein